MALQLKREVWGYHYTLRSQPPVDMLVEATAVDEVKQKQ